MFVMHYDEYMYLVPPLRKGIVKRPIGSHTLASKLQCKCVELVSDHSFHFVTCILLLCCCIYIYLIIL